MILGVEQNTDLVLAKVDELFGDRSGLGNSKTQELVALTVFARAGLEKPSEIFRLVVVLELAESFFGFGGGGHVPSLLGLKARNPTERPSERLPSPLHIASAMRSLTLFFFGLKC